MLGKTYLNLGEKSHNHKKFEASLRHRGFFSLTPYTNASVCTHRTADIGSGSRELNKGEQVPRPARSSGARRARTAALAEGACEASQPSRQQRCAGLGSGQSAGREPLEGSATEGYCQGTPQPPRRRPVPRRPISAGAPPTALLPIHPRLRARRLSILPSRLTAASSGQGLRPRSCFPPPTLPAAVPRHPPADAAISPRGPGSCYLKRKCHCVSLAPGFRLY